MTGPVTGPVTGSVSRAGARRIAAAGLLLAPLACARPELPSGPITCAAVRPSGRDAPEVRADDPLEVYVVFDSVPAEAGGVRLRVDGLGQGGIVNFGEPTPTAAGMTLDVPARYHGCAALAPVGLELRAPFPPRGKAWVRVSTDRPVRLHLRAGERASAPVLTRPGKSALASWDLVR